LLDDGSVSTDFWIDGEWAMYDEKKVVAWAPFGEIEHMFDFNNEDL
jgi:hypothetical protein